MSSRLEAAAAAAVLCGLIGLAGLARGQEAASSGVVVEADGEYSTYGDTNDVYVYTPAVSAGVQHPLDGWGLHGSYLVDVVSAASVDIVSTASPAWQEVRHAGSASGTYKAGDTTLTAAGSFSREPDYLSLSGGGNVSVELLDKALTLLAGYTYGHDTAGRTGTPYSVYSLELVRHTMGGAANVVLDRESALTFSIDAILERGNQEKPYRYVPVFDAETASLLPAGASADVVNEVRLPGRIAEVLPESRNRYALSGRLAQRVESATAIIWQRGYLDDWGVKASTTDLRFVVDLSDRFYFWPHLRLHTQTAASFWQRAYVASFADAGQVSVPRLRTGDRELSPLTTFTGGLGARWDLTSQIADSRYSLVFIGDAAVTRYWDALFIENRFALFGAIQLEAAFK